MRGRGWLLVGILTALVTVALAAQTPPHGRKFFDDDPLWRVPDSQDAKGAAFWEPDLGVDLTLNLFAKLGDQTPNVRAQDLNTVDEVPDSSWFTNRAGHRTLTVADVSRGPDTDDGPLPGMWRIISAKSDGVTPGFTVTDRAGTVWFLKFDPPGYRAMATGTEVTVTKLMWALGYYVPENHIATLRVDQLAVDPKATVRPPGEPRRPMRIDDIARLLKRADREPDGSYRVIAGKALPGKLVGRLQFFGTRPDDPNDIVPHEHRRSLRGYGVFSAWFNHVDAKAINTDETLITEGGRSYIRHNILDFGSTLGSASVGPRELWEGYEYLFEPGDAIRRIPTFGFPPKAWRTDEMYEAPSIGRLPKDNTRFNPDAWRPRVPNQAFLRARADDKFWAAMKMAALTDDMLRAAVRAGRFDDPPSEAFLVKALIERRDAILRAYLPAVNPISAPALGALNALTFENAAVSARVTDPPAGYRAVWSRFDNATGLSQRIGETSGTGLTLSAPAGMPTAPGSFIHVEISATGSVPAAWTVPVHAYFKRVGGEWKLVGFERMPDSGQ